MATRSGLFAWFGLLSVLACHDETLEVGTGVLDAASANTGAGEGGSGGQIIASGIATPTKLVSDGTTLFWGEFGNEIWSMPVAGGTISLVVSDQIGGDGGGVNIAVDSVNVYYQVPTGIKSVPKSGGGSPRLVSEPTDAGLSFVTWTVLGSTAYWLEGSEPDGGQPGEFAVRSAPLSGGAVTTVADFESDIAFFWIGVTDSTVFLSSGNQVAWFPMSQGVPDGGALSPVVGLSPAGQPVSAMSGGPSVVGDLLFSDTDAVVCENNESFFRIASDGTVTTLATNMYLLSDVGSNVAVDDTFVYWLASTLDGAVMRAPKTGGTATLIAKDTNPVAIAVDSKAIYWSDERGSIWRANK